MNVIDKLNNSYRENRIYYFMVLIFFCVGIALGAFMVKYMNINDSTDLSNYFSSFTESILVSQVESTKLFFNILIKISITVVIIIILGFTVFGIPFILLIDLIKGFTLGYTFTFLLTTCTIIIRIPTNEISSIIKKSTPHIRSTFSSKASRI